MSGSTMKNYMNIFLTLVMPLSILFTAIAFVYYSTSFVFSKAIKLGIVTGVISSTLFALLLAVGILLIRKVQENNPKRSNRSFNSTSFNTNKIPKVLNKNKENFDINSLKIQSLENKFILLMDRELAYEVSLQSMYEQNIGEVIYQNKTKGLILLKDGIKEFKINITMLTKHTAEIVITSTLDHHFIKNIILGIKNKEYHFLNY
jgi:hypothetical protein